MDTLLYLAPLMGVIALLFAATLAARVSKQEEGTDRMKEIASAIADGAKAFLMAEYKILIIFVVILFIVIGAGSGNWVTAVCFLLGGLFSTAAGYFGMNVATKANVRTANAARTSGMNKALSIAFSGGAVMGMCVAGLGVLGCGAVYMLTKNVDVLSGFSMGASSIALFARVGGGIYTKAADVGADLVGKVEAGIPRTTRATLRLSLTTWATTWAMWPVWAPTCSSPMWVPSYLPSPWAWFTMRRQAPSSR